MYVGLHLPPSLSSIALMSRCHYPLPHSIIANLVALSHIFVFLADKPIGSMLQRHFLGGEGGAWYEKGVTLHGLRISEKKEILRKLTVL